MCCVWLGRARFCSLVAVDVHQRIEREAAAEEEGVAALGVAALGVAAASFVSSFARSDDVPPSFGFSPHAPPWLLAPFASSSSE